MPFEATDIKNDPSKINTDGRYYNSKLSTTTENM